MTTTETSPPTTQLSTPIPPLLVGTPTPEPARVWSNTMNVAPVRVPTSPAAMAFPNSRTPTPPVISNSTTGHITVEHQERHAGGAPIFLDNHTDLGTHPQRVVGEPKRRTGHDLHELHSFVAGSGSTSPDSNDGPKPNELTFPGISDSAADHPQCGSHTSHVDGASTSPTTSLPSYSNDAASLGISSNTADQMSFENQPVYVGGVLTPQGPATDLPLPIVNALGLADPTLLTRIGVVR